MIACSKCGTALADDLRFCTECGTAVVSPAEPRGSIPTIVTPRFTPAAFGPTGAPQPAAKSNRSALIILAAVVVILLIALLALATRLVLSPTPNTNTGSGNNSRESSPEVGNARTTPTPFSSRNVTPSPTPRVVSSSTSSARQAVIDTLEGWAAAARAHDLDSHMSYFADRLDRYYLEYDVSAAHIRATLQPAYDRYSRLDVQLSNVVVDLEPDGTKATVTLDKTYAFKGDKTMSGSVKEMIWLSMASGRWRITGIRDLQVYYQNK